MKYFLIAFVTLLGLQFLNAQDLNTTKELDSLYREDQIYLSVTYNILNNRLRDVSQNGFSGGFHLGFIRDFPVNTKRNVALGVGFGLSSSTFNQNLKISKANDEFSYEVLTSGFNKNRFTLYQLEMPFEFRWRTSTPESYKFWRIYTGFKMGYVFYSTAKLVTSDENYNLNINDIVNRLQYGLTVSVGYDTWNLHVYYGLNNIFKYQSINSNPIELSTIKAGLIFYIL